MLLRYLSHQTRFSKSLEIIDDREVLSIGLYWKIDTQISHLLQKRNLQEDVWFSAFENLSCLMISIEIIKALESVAKSNYAGFGQKEFHKIKIDSLSSFISDLPKDLYELRSKLKNKLVDLQIWLSNIRKRDVPDFLPMAFTHDLIRTIKESAPTFEKSTFHVYVDEYENLLEYQQRIVNTWVKHSEHPLIFNLAMKRNAFRTRSTIGEETLTNVHDYRYIDLEKDGFSDFKEFKIFAAEILLYRLKRQGIDNLEVDDKLLTEPSRILDRKKEDYRDKILFGINKIFPSITHKELANEVFSEKHLRDRLESKLKEALKFRKSTIKHNQFIYKNDLRVSIVCIPLLYRENLQPEAILKQIELLRNNKENSFTGKTEWVKNNFFGAYILFYNGLNKPCPIYSGFDTFCLMSYGNIRHLTELCYKTFLRSSDDNTSSQIVDISNITISSQAQAARQASSMFLNEIRTFGKYGNRLHTFCLRLGGIFNLAHKRKKQSEPEQNHFVVSKGKINISEDISEFLNEAVKWSILFEERPTKIKSQHDSELKEYILNPIYSPYFLISYRKMRKLSFTSDEFQSLVLGSVDDYESLLKGYLSKWRINKSDNTQTDLFFDLKL